MRPFNYKKPAVVDGVLADKTSGVEFIAGGTNLVDLMKKHIMGPDSLIDLSGALSDKIELVTQGIRIGAMAKNSAVANHKEIRSKYPLVAKAILAGASPQIRNMATTSGNILQRTRCPYFYDVAVPCNKRNPGSGCSSIGGDNRMSAIIGYSEQCVAVHPSDMCVALAALDASVDILQKDQKRHFFRFRDFHRLPDQRPDVETNLTVDALITGVIIPKNLFYKNYAYVKLRDRDSYAFALVSVAAALQLEGKKIVEARLASGGVAHKPWRWLETEEFLKGKEANAANFRKAAEIAADTTRPLEGNQFKLPLLKGAIETALQQSLTV